MLNWLRSFFGGIGGGVAAGVLNIVQGAVNAIAAVIDTVFGHVLAGWKELARWAETAAHLEDKMLAELFKHVWQIVTHDIPAWAWTAWWWVTHPDKLAAVLFWHLIRLLEDNAWIVAGILGKFVLALILRNARRVAGALEQIVTAIL